MGDKSSGEGPPPPSPLTGAYLLIVLPQTHQPQHKDYVIHNLTKGLLTWDKTDCHVDLEKELQTITAQAPEGEEAKNGERLIQFASENLVTEVLIHPQLNTLVQCMRNLLSSFTRHRHIIHAGYTCAGNGAWMLQDGTYSYADFAEMYQEHEVQRVLRAYENTVTVDVHCLQEGDWNNLRGKDPFSKVSRVRLNPKDCATSTPSLKGFLDYLVPYISSGSIEELLESSDVVGNIRFSHPTLYVFPGGQGDAALFGINGFNMLVDGGFARKACFWDFSRHLDRLDAVLMTRLNNGNIQGMTSLLQRKKMEHVYPQIGHFFCNMQERKHPLSPDGDKDKDPLLVSLFDQGQEILGSLRHLQLKPQPCYRDPVLEPINLYHKVGHGKLDMYVISPAKDSREVREFMAKWTTQDSKIFCSFTKRGGEFNFPLSNKVSICALLVWQPANPEDNITRLLFPGSTPQHKIFEGLDKLKNLEFMKHAVCSARTLSPSSSSVGLNVRTVSKPKVPASVDKIIENEDKKIEAVKQPIMKPPTGQTEKQPPKSQPPPSRPPSKQKPAEKPKEKLKTEVEVKTEKPETAKTDKAKPDKIDKIEAVQKIDKPKEKSKRPITKQPEKKKPVGGEKKDSLKSSPTTPKKITENKVSETQPKPDIKPRASSRTKPSPSATPAKSAKEANNRKVLEQKKEATKRVPPAKKEDAKKTEKPAATRKSVPSPSKAEKQQVSPIKAPRPVIKPKQEAKKTIKTEKDVVTDSVVSTPSTVDVELAKTKEDLAEKDTKDDVKVDEPETTEQPSLSKDEEDEILVIEKIEIEGTGKDQPEESIAVHIRTSREDIIADDDEGKEEFNADLPSEDKKEIPDTDSKQLSDVQDLTKDAPDTSKSRVEFLATEEASITKEPATDKLTPKDKEGKEKSTDIGDVKQTDESQPDEKFSTTVESGATTAPTLPEDERIPLDEIKEGIEEKHVKEETKEKEIGFIHRPEQPTSLPEVPVISSTPFDQRVHLLKDIVKTPDEVADLPVHEEADGGFYAGDETQLSRDLQKSKEDLLGIPSSKKASEKKEDAAEEVKLVKDENEKEDATKDLKEDDEIIEKKSVLPMEELIPQAVDEGKDDDKAIVKQDVKAESSKPEKPLATLEPEYVEDIGALEGQQAEKMGELTKVAAGIPAGLEDEEILDEDKDKESEKEKLLQKETKEVGEDVEEKADKEKIDEKQMTKTIVDEDIKVEKPVIEDGATEEGKAERKTSVGETEPPQEPADSIAKKSKDEVVTEEHSHVPKSPKPIDEKAKSPQPEADGAKSPESIIAEKAKSQEHEDEEAKSQEPVSQKAQSAEPVADKAKSPDTVAEGAKSPEPVIAEKAKSQEHEAEDAKTAEPEGQKAKSPELVAEKAKSPEPVAEKAKSPEPIISEETKLPEPEAQKIKFPEPVDEKAKSPEPITEKVIPPEESVGEKSKSPESVSEKAKSPEPATEKAKSPEPVAEKAESPEADDEKAKSPEPITEKVKSPEPVEEKPKSPESVGENAKSPEPATEEAKSPEPVAEKAKSPEPAVEKAKSPEPITEKGKSPEAVSEKTKSPEPVVEKALSPEPATEKAKSPEPVVEKALSPEPATEKAKSPEPVVEKALSPEPATEKAKSPEPITEKVESPEPATEKAKSPEPVVEKALSPEPATEKAKSPEPITEKVESPEPAVEKAKSPEPITEKGKSPEPLSEKTKSPEPVIEKAQSPEPATEIAKSPEPIDEKTKSTEPVGDGVKSPEPKSEKAKPPEPEAEKAKSPEPIEEKNKSPEPAAEKVELIEPVSEKARSPEPVTDEAKSPEPIISAKAKTSEDEGEKAKSLVPDVEKVKSPEPISEKAKPPEPEAEKARSPEPMTAGDKSSEPCIAEKSKSPEPISEKAKSPEPGVEKAKSPEPGVEKAKSSDIDAVKSKSPEAVSEKTKLSELEAEKVKSPEPVNEKTKSPEPVADEAKSPEPITVEKAKSPQQETEGPKSPEPVGEKAKSPEPLDGRAKSTDPEADKAESPEPVGEKVKSTEPVDGNTKSPEHIIEKPIGEKPKSPQPATEKAKSPEPVDEKVESPEPVTEKAKSPQPVADKAKYPEPSGKKAKSPEPVVDGSKSPESIIAEKTKLPEPLSEKVTSPEPISEKAKSPEPVADKAKYPEPSDEKAKSPEPVVDRSKSPEPIIAEKTQSQESVAEKVTSLEPSGEKAKSPEPVVDRAKSPETIAEKTESPEPVAEKTKSPEPVSEKAKSPEPATVKGKSPEPATEKTESPETLSEEAKSSEPVTYKAKSPEPVVEKAKSPVPVDESGKSTGAVAEKSKSPEPVSEKAISPEPVVEKGKSPDPVSEKANTPEILGEKAESPKLLDERIKSPDQLSEVLMSHEPSSKQSISPSPEPPGGTAKLSMSPSPEPQTEIVKSTEPSLEHFKSAPPESAVEHRKSLELEPNISKSPSPDLVLAEVTKSPEPSKSPLPEAKDEDVKFIGTKAAKSPPPEPHTEGLKVDEPPIQDVKSSLLESHAELEKTPLPEPLEKLSKSPSPVQAVESRIFETEESKNVLIDDDGVLGDKEDDLKKKVMTKEELNQEIMVEKEVDEESEPDDSDRKNKSAQIKEAEDETTIQRSINNEGLDSKAESLKLEAEKHEKEHPVEVPKAKDGASTFKQEDLIRESQEELGKVDDSQKEKPESINGKHEKDEKDPTVSEEIDTSKIEKEKEEKSTGEPSVSMLGTSGADFKTDDRVPSISLREASIEQTSEESAPSKLEENVSVKESPLKDIMGEIDILDRKLSSGEVSIISLDADEKQDTEQESKGASKSSTRVEFDVEDKSVSPVDSQRATVDTITATLCFDSVKAEVRERSSIPESVKLEEDKDAVEVRSKEDSKDEALVLDKDLVIEKDDKVRSLDDKGVTDDSSIPDVAEEETTTKDTANEKPQVITPGSTSLESQKDASAKSLADATITSSSSDSEPSVLDGKPVKDTIKKDEVPVKEETIDPPTDIVLSKITSVESTKMDLDEKKTDEVEKPASARVETIIGESVKSAVLENETSEKGDTITGSAKAESTGKVGKQSSTESEKQLPDSAIKPATEATQKEEKTESLDINDKDDTAAKINGDKIATDSSDGTLSKTETSSKDESKKEETITLSPKHSEQVLTATGDKVSEIETSSKAESLKTSVKESIISTTTEVSGPESGKVGSLLQESGLGLSSLPSEPEVSLKSAPVEIPSTMKEQVHFAQTTTDSKQSLESIEPLVIEETTTVTAKTITDAGKVTSTIAIKSEEPTPKSKSSGADDISAVEAILESVEVSEKVGVALDEFTTLTNGKMASDITHETDKKVIKDTTEEELDAKKGDIRVTDILDTAERIVSSLNGKKTISDEPSDYIPSFSETKSYTLTIEGKRGPSDEITVETKSFSDDGELQQATILSEKEEAVPIALIEGEEKLRGVSSPTNLSGGLNGHGKSDKIEQERTLKDCEKGETQSSVSKSDAPEKSAELPATTTSLPTESQSVAEVIGDTTGTISGAVTSTIDLIASSDLLRSTTSSTKGSTSASPELSTKSDDPAKIQSESKKVLSDSKLDPLRANIIDVTSSFLSMEMGVSQGSEKSLDLSGSSSRSGEKGTETTDKKSSLSSTQVEPPTDKEHPLLPSVGAFRTQKEFSRSETPASDILSDRDIEIGHCTPYSDTSSGQVSRAVTHVWDTVEGRPESRHYDSDDDIPGSPMSISSHIPSPPQFDYDSARPQDPMMMMSSFYGSLPGDFEEGVKMHPGDIASTYDFVIQDKVSESNLKKELGGDKLSASIRSSLTSTPESSPLPERRFESLLATSKEATPPQPMPPSTQPSDILPSSSTLPPKPDPIEKWDKPLGLPPPHSTDSSTPYLRWNPYKEWGKPLGLPSPAPPPREDTDVEVDTSGSAKTTPKKVSKMNAENNKYSSNMAKEASNKSKRSESPVKRAQVKDGRKSGPTPVYMDLSYVPHHGNSNYATVEFFKRVRARYYVFSGTEPSKEVFNALLEAKQSWEDKELEVTIIPTYDTDTLGYWIAENEETLSKLKIDLSPSASRCTINLQDHDTSCSAYRLEF